MIDKNIIEDIKKINITDYLTMNGYTIKRTGTDSFKCVVCPLCGSGDHFTIQPSTNMYKSFGASCTCNKSRGTIIDLVMELKKIDFVDAVKLLADSYNITLNDIENNTKKSVKTIKQYDFTPLVNKYITLNNDYSYFCNRGIAVDTIKKYKIVVDELGINNFFKEYKELSYSFGWIYTYFIPIFENGVCTNFVIRANDDKLHSVIDKAPNMKLNKTHNLKGVSMGVWNCDYLIDTSSIKDNLLFICEGIFDALSLEQEGFSALSANSANNFNKVIELIKFNKSNLDDVKFILCGDNDKAGMRFNKSIQDALNELNLQSIILTLDGHDINDIYIDNRDALLQSINTAISNLNDNYEKMKDYLLDMKLNTLSLKERMLFIQENRRSSNNLLKTGFDELDSLIGFLDKKIINIGAVPGVGKTTLYLQIALNLVKQKKHVIFYSLELDKMFIYSKILSYLSKNEISSKCFISASRINQFLTTRISVLEAHEEENLMNLIDLFEREYLNYLHVDDFIDLKTNVIRNRTIEYIRDSTKNFIVKHKEIPVVFVDYIQKLSIEHDAGKNDKQIMDAISDTLINMKMTLGLTMFIVSSLNRDSYLEPISELSFKESGAIEYSADILLGLQWRNMAEIVQSSSSRSDLKDKISKLKASSRNVKELECVCIKNRTGVAGDSINLDFYGAFNTFTAAGENPWDLGTQGSEKDTEEAITLFEGVAMSWT